MKFDVMGRIDNMDLPDGKSAVLYSVYEAVSNSVHAIHDKFGEEKVRKKGRIQVEIIHGDDHEIKAIQITDNGEGFTEANLDSFETSDSRLKYARGGKGVGRLIWIKTFHDIRVESQYCGDQGNLRSLSFDFRPELDDSKANLTDNQYDGSKDTGATITLSRLRTPLTQRINKATFLKDLAVHFFPQFLDNILPEIVLKYRGETDSLNDYIEGRIDEPTRQVVESRQMVKLGMLGLTTYLLIPRSRQNYAILTFSPPTDGL